MSALTTSTPTTDVDESEQQWGTTILVDYDADADNMPEGYAAPTYTIQTNTGDDGAWTDASGTAVQDEDNVDIPGRFTIPTPDAASGGDGEFKVRVVTTADETTPSDPAVPYSHTSMEVTIEAVDPSASGVAARRQAEATSDSASADGDFIIAASWTAVTNGNSDFRVVVQVTPASLGGSNAVWVILNNTDVAGTARAFNREIADTFGEDMSVALPGGEGADGGRHRCRPQQGDQRRRRIATGCRE